jgi:hypothetical protein
MFTIPKAFELECLRKRDDAYSWSVLEWDRSHLEKIRNIATTTTFGFRWDAEESAKWTTNQLVVEKASGTEPRRFLGSKSMVGFASSHAQVGDLICQFWGCDITVVLRQQGDRDCFWIVGTADVSVERDRDWMDLINMDLTKWKSYDEAAKSEKFQRMINLNLDIETLQQLTC